MYSKFREVMCAKDRYYFQSEILEFDKYINLSLQNKKSYRFLFSLIWKSKISVISIMCKRRTRLLWNQNPRQHFILIFTISFLYWLLVLYSNMFQLLYINLLLKINTKWFISWPLFIPHMAIINSEKELYCWECTLIQDSHTALFLLYIFDIEVSIEDLYHSICLHSFLFFLNLKNRNIYLTVPQCSLMPNICLSR